MDDFTEQFKSLLSSPLGKLMLDELEKYRQSLLEDAEREDSQDKSYGFTKKAAGVKLAIGRLQTLATILPRDEGGKANSN